MHIGMQVLLYVRLVKTMAGGNSSAEEELEREAKENIGNLNNGKYLYTQAKNINISQIHTNPAYGRH